MQLLAKSRKPQYCLCSMRTIHKLNINQIKFHMVTSHSFVSLVQFERHWPDDVCSKNSGIPIQSLASNIIPFALISADVQFLSTQMRPIVTETDAILSNHFCILASSSSGKNHAHYHNAGSDCPAQDV